MFRPGLLFTSYSSARNVASKSAPSITSSRHGPSTPLRFYSQPPGKTTFNRSRTGQTSARAPRSSSTSNVITFLTASSIGVGAYMYQWNKDRQGSIFSSISAPEGLTTENWTPILLKNITKISESTSLFEFELPKPCVIPLSSAVYVKDDLIQAMRAYTPVHSTETEQNTLQLLIKRYGEGQVSRFMHSARPGQKIEMRGPILVWPASRPDLEKWDEIGMIAGGTGITAMIPIIQSVLANPDKKIKISLLFAAQSSEELYFKDELDQMAEASQNQLRVVYTIDKTPVGSSSEQEWKGHVGYVNEDMLKGLLPPPKSIAEGALLTGEMKDDTEKGAKNSIVLVCGPESMVKHVAGTRGTSGQEPIRGILGAMGYTKDQVFRFPN